MVKVRETKVTQRPSYDSESILNVSNGIIDVDDDYGDDDNNCDDYGGDDDDDDDELCIAIVIDDDMTYHD